MGVIYKITNPKGNFYVGKSFNLKSRISNYKYDTQRGSNIIIRSIRKYGWDAHVIEVLEECDNDILSEREIYWIKQLKSCKFDNPKGMNLTYGGDNPSWMHDKQRRMNQSKKFSGSGNPFFGKTHSQEYKAKKSEEVSMYNKEKGRRIPDWGAEKGRDIVRTPILKYGINGVFLKKYKSLSEAELELGICHSQICKCCSEEITQAGGYIFRYKTENYPLTIKVEKVKFKTVKRPVLFFMGNTLIEYPSSLEASNDLRVPKTTINRAAMYNQFKPIRSGHVFIYKDLFEGILKAAS